MSGDLGPPGREHPEGAPGIFDQFARQVYGDGNYEEAQAMQQKLTKIGVDQLEAKTALWKIVPFIVLMVAFVVCFCLVWIVVT